MSMIDPVGATISNNTVAIADCTQKDPAEPSGGRLVTCAGIAVDIEVSETSLAPARELTEFHLIEHVATLPWDGGGDQIVTWWSFIAAHRVDIVVLATVPIPPYS
jgi:hypothetical protein